MKIADAGTLDDRTLTTRLTGFAGAERGATVALIVHLAEFDQRKLYRGAGFHSLFEYCVEVLRLSEDAAANRIAAARMARRHPDVVDRLAAGSLSPTTVRLIAKHATAENGRALIEAATGRTKRDVEKLLARLFPEREVPASIRPLGPAPSPAPLAPAPRSAPLVLAAALSPVAGGTEAATRSRLPSEDTNSLPVQRVDAPPPMAAARPSPDRFEIRFTAKADTVEKLKMVQDLLSHAVPTGDIAEVVDRALTALAEQLLRKKFAVTNAPRKTTDSTSDADEPAAVKRAAYLHDRGRCTYVSQDGRRCESRRFLQFDHILGRAVGGGFTVGNVRLLCGPHNRLEAERLYATPPGARDAGGARVDLAGFMRAGGKNAETVVLDQSPVPGRTPRRTSSGERETTT